jgi:hypothetical protein
LLRFDAVGETVFQNALRGRIRNPGVLSAAKSGPIPVMHDLRDAKVRRCRLTG